mmetsp:Transcript_49675/g.113739  ORF Transcript_49675/g.113739 Transcript_49675/m.113739 type:complete len:232 (-) Transcript_49675:372-1067(-)
MAKPTKVTWGTGGCGGAIPKQSMYPERDGCICCGSLSHYVGQCTQPGADAARVEHALGCKQRREALKLGKPLGGKPQHSNAMARQAITLGETDGEELYGFGYRAIAVQERPQRDWMDIKLTTLLEPLWLKELNSFQLDCSDLAGEAKWITDEIVLLSDFQLAPGSHDATALLQTVDSLLEDCERAAACYENIVQAMDAARRHQDKQANIALFPTRFPDKMGNVSLSLSTRA